MKLASIMILSSLALTVALPAPGFASVSSKDGWSNAGQQNTVERRKKRVKGGSGCDDPGDVAEHPECR